MMTRAISLMAIFVATNVLSGCATVQGLTPDSTKAICEAMIGPIKYNSYVKTSRRFAGPDLAPDLASRNRVGGALGCPLYR